MGNCERAKSNSLTSWTLAVLDTLLLLHSAVGSVSLKEEKLVREGVNISEAD